MNNKSLWKRILKVVLWIVGIIILLLAIGVFFRAPVITERAKTEQAVAQIHAERLTLDDVMGKNLPPKPDQATNDATLAGIDANHNGIRDDVELAVFKMYPNSARIRAAELQYAMELQNEMTPLVFNSGTLAAVAQEESRGDLCISYTEPEVSLSNTRAEIQAAFAIGAARSKEVKDFMLNTPARLQKRAQDYQYMTSVVLQSDSPCDIDPTTLQN